MPESLMPFGSTGSPFTREQTPAGANARDRRGSDAPSGMLPGATEGEVAFWMEDNERGLVFAAEADWSEATEAFASAADALSRHQTSTSHEPLALVLSNLAHACFKSGRLTDGIQHAQRAYALRVALVGEDAVMVARSRMDLAVMLGSVGRLDEAQSLVQRAIRALEHAAGEEDVRLAVLLENAARLALAARSPANAEPLLLRLHALLAAHGLPTTPADRLLARIGESRTTEAAIASMAAHATRAASETLVAAPPTVETLITPLAQDDEWDDQPLRDAVTMTDVLLRTTPRGVPVVEVPTIEDEERNAPAAAENLLVKAMAAQPKTYMQVELTDDFDLIAPPPTTLDEVPNAPSDLDSHLLLGFAIEHGLGSLLEESNTPVDDTAEAADVEAEAATPATISGVDLDLDLVAMEPLPLDAPWESGYAELPPVDTPPSMATEEPQYHGWVPAAVPADPPHAQPIAVVMPSPKGSKALETTFTTPASGKRGVGDLPSVRTRTMNTPAQPQPKKSGGGMLMGGAVLLAAAGGAAWWFLLK